MATIAGQAAVSPAGPAARARSRFFANASIVIAALILAAFARTYFVPLATGSTKFILLRHVHGAVFFTWLAPYVVQSNLAADVLLLPLALHDRRVLGRVPRSRWPRRRCWCRSISLSR
jgi:hypothetical protein